MESQQAALGSWESWGHEKGSVAEGQSKSKGDGEQAWPTGAGGDRA